MNDEELKQLSIFSREVLTEKDEEKVKEGKRKGYRDPACVIELVTKDKAVQRMLGDRIEELKAPELDYSKGAKSKFSVEYLKKAIALFDGFDESVTLCVGKDYPLTIIGKKFEIRLAPRVE